MELLSEPTHFLLLERDGPPVSGLELLLSALAVSKASFVTGSTAGGLFLYVLAFAFTSSEKPRCDPSPLVLRCPSGAVEQGAGVIGMGSV